MKLIPAIDLKDGRCVRLKQGRFDTVTEFSSSPIDRATYFSDLGAQRLHIVDLDGAQTGFMRHLQLISEMKSATMSIQVGGGIRSLEQAQSCRAAGITQLVLGSVAITNPQLTQKIIEIIGAEHIILAIDVKLDSGIPKPTSHGWQTTCDTTLWEITHYYEQLGIRDILCTDIACDGMMKGPNFKLYQEAVQRFPGIKWQASGGIRHLEDIKQLEADGVAAAILGLTLYLGDFVLTKQSFKESIGC